MRSLAASWARWKETPQDVAALREAVARGGPASPCEAGCRSVCWKIFLLFHGTPPSDRLPALRAARADYAAARDQHLQFIKHPERLTELTLDPLADDPESPWDLFRRDEVVRAEILQDVRRLPDHPLYHQDAVQTLILDVLFVFCKRHPHLGGYRQGMHELLAPLVAVLHEDACEREADDAADTAAMADMAETLDAAMLEHDAYALFAAIMRHASRFYEFTSKARSRSSSAAVPPDPAAPPSAKDLVLAAERASALAPAIVPVPPSTAETSAIVEMSTTIHQHTLMRVDPELALHLQAIEILPQIFLIRWIRLLFSREFPFDQLLVLWDRLFAVDPSLDLVPLVCVAMLLRIRWELLDADYSLALQALLKYPPPPPPHSPHTFVADAVFLRDHLDPAGGAALIQKYTGRAPAAAALDAQTEPSSAATPGLSAAASASASVSPTPSLPPPASPAAAALAAGFGSLRNRTLRVARRSSPARHSSDGGSSPGMAASAPLGSPPQRPQTPPPSLSPQPAPSPARFLQNNRESMEALLQSAAKGVLGRGQKLGINQAVRDAVGEIRRNMVHGFQEARQRGGSGGGGGGGGAAAAARRFPPFLPSHHGDGPQQQQQLPLQDVHDAHVLVAEMERRNRQLAGLLDETVAALQALVAEAGAASTPASPPADDNDRPQRWRETVEIAAAKVQFVKVHLEDASLLLPFAGDSDDDDDDDGGGGQDGQDQSLPAAAPAASPPEVARPVPSDPFAAQTAPPPPPPPPVVGEATAGTNTTASAGDTAAAATTTGSTQSPPPVRSTLAQSSLAWMLDDAAEEPGRAARPGVSAGATTAASTTARRPPSPPAAAAAAAGRRSTDRARHAFLFGEPAESSSTTSSTTSAAPASQTAAAQAPSSPSPGNRRGVSSRSSGGGGGVQRRAGVRSPVRVTAVAADDEVLGS